MQKPDQVAHFLFPFLGSQRGVVDHAVGARFFEPRFDVELAHLLDNVIDYNRGPVGGCGVFLSGLWCALRYRIVVVQVWDLNVPRRANEWNSLFGEDYYQSLSFGPKTEN